MNMSEHADQSGKPAGMPELGHDRLDELLDFLSITESQLREMKHFCDECGVVFSSTPFSENEVDALVEMDVPFIKIASMDLNNLPFIHYAAKTKKPQAPEEGPEGARTIAPKGLRNRIFPEEHRLLPARDRNQ